MRMIALAVLLSVAAPLEAQATAVATPRTPLALKAEQYVRGTEPDFLFNHSVRTYLFGAARLRARGIRFDPETAYVAALFHDLGFVASMASSNASFELDGATRAEAFVEANGGTPRQGRIVWNAIVHHDLPAVYQVHQSPEALLVGTGAATDVVGYDPKALSKDSVEQVLRAYPRLQMKKRFLAMMVDHCRRKPASQIGWLDRLCREQSPNVDRGSVEKEINGAPFAQ